jgi:hypothetical protein
MWVIFSEETEKSVCEKSKGIRLIRLIGINASGEKKFDFEMFERLAGFLNWVK